MSIFTDLAGTIFRMIPPIRGKGRLAQMILAPFIRGKGHEIVVEMSNPGGGRLICNLDDWIPWNVYLYGRYHIERNYEAFMMRAVAGSKVVLDVGANIGYYTIQFGRTLRRDGGVVHAFEPCTYQYATLLKNVELNDLPNVVVKKCIVSDVNGERKKIFFSGMSNTGSSSLEVATGQYEEVECTTVDDYCQQAGIDQIDVQKIDVEGHEMSVLRGMQRMLSAGKIVNLFLEINSSALAAAGTSGREIVDYLQRFGYQPYSIASGEVAEYRVGNDESLVLFSRDG